MTDHVYQQLREHLAYLKLPAARRAARRTRSSRPRPRSPATHGSSPTCSQSRSQRPSSAGSTDACGSRASLSTRRSSSSTSTPNRRWTGGSSKSSRPCGSSQEKANVLLIGPPGVGKTMLATALGLKAVHAGYRVYYTTAADLVARTTRAAIEGRWQTTMRFWTRPSRPRHRRARLPADARRSRQPPLPGDQPPLPTRQRDPDHQPRHRSMGRDLRRHHRRRRDPRPPAAPRDRPADRRATATACAATAPASSSCATRSRPSRRPSHERHQRRGSERPAARAAPAGAEHRAVPAHARQLAAQLSTLFDRDVEIVKRLNDAHHRLQRAPTNGSAQDSRPTRSASPTTTPRRQRSAPARSPRSSATVGPRQQPDARGPASSTLADPSRASAPTNSLRAAPSARVRRRRALPTAHPGAVRRRLERGPGAARQRAPTRQAQSSTGAPRGSWRLRR